ncbi:PA3496 family putative envelope integrity protein [Vibrio sp. 10N.222.49.C9]
MQGLAGSWDELNATPEATSNKQLKSAEARRRIEQMREIRESGLTLEEARELGLLH